MLATSFGGCRAKGVSIMQSVMLAGHRQGSLITAVILLFAAMWLSWLPRQLPSLSQFAAIALFGCAVAWLVSMTLLPAALSLLAPRRPAEEPNWLDEALGGTPAPARRNALDAAAMVVLAAAIFCAVFLPAVRFGERQLPSAPPPLIETPDARGAIHILAPEDRVEELVSKLAGLAEVGAVRTASQFLPPQAPEKIAELQAAREPYPLRARIPGPGRRCGPAGPELCRTGRAADGDRRRTRHLARTEGRGPAAAPRGRALHVAAAAHAGTRGGTRARAFRRAGAALRR